MSGRCYIPSILFCLSFRPNPHESSVKLSLLLHVHKLLSRAAAEQRDRMARHPTQSPIPCPTQLHHRSLLPYFPYECDCMPQQLAKAYLDMLAPLTSHILHTPAPILVFLLHLLP